jgi:hypothetical protein
VKTSQRGDKKIVPINGSAGHEAGAPAAQSATEAAVDPAMIKISDEQAIAEIRALNAGVIRARQVLESAAYDFGATQSALMNRVRAVCQANGVAVDDPSKGKWHFDMDRMTITKVG